MPQSDLVVGALTNETDGLATHRTNYVHCPFRPSFDDGRHHLGAGTATDNCLSTKTAFKLSRFVEIASLRRPA